MTPAQEELADWNRPGGFFSLSNWRLAGWLGPLVVPVLADETLLFHPRGPSIESCAASRP